MTAIMPKDEAQKLLDLIGEFGREVHYLLDDCETSGPVGEEVHTITSEGLEKVSSILDRIEALPFEAPGYILGPGAMLQEAIKQTFVSEADAQAAVEAERERCAEIAAERWAAHMTSADRLGAFDDEKSQRLSKDAWCRATEATAIKAAIREVKP